MNIMNFEQTSLMSAVVYDSDQRIVQYLIAEGADTNLRLEPSTMMALSMFLITRLLHRCRSCRETVRVLVEGQGGTCLHIAALHGNANVCQLLLDARADIRAKNFLQHDAADITTVAG